MMKLLVDGHPVEFKESLELVGDNCVVGCHCNGGVHTEVHGKYRIHIDEESISVNMLIDEEVSESCIMSMEDLFAEMHKTVVIMQNQEEIRHIGNLFSKI